MTTTPVVCDFAGATTDVPANARVVFQLAQWSTSGSVTLLPESTVALDGDTVDLHDTALIVPPRVYVATAQWWDAVTQRQETAGPWIIAPTGTTPVAFSALLSEAPSTPLPAEVLAQCVAAAASALAAAGIAATQAGAAGASATAAAGHKNAASLSEAAADDAADRAEAARDLAETYAGIPDGNRATSVAGLPDPATLTTGDSGLVSGSGNPAVDGLYEVQAGTPNTWLRVGDSLFAQVQAQANIATTQAGIATTQATTATTQAGIATTQATTATTQAGIATTQAGLAAVSKIAAENAAIAAADDFDHVAQTKAAADAWAVGQADGLLVQVLTDESLTDRRTVYRVASDALVYVRDLGDQTRVSIAARDGATGHLRNTMTTLAKWSDDIIGNVGASNNDIVPLTITASQSGTTVTATTNAFQKLHIGMRVLWESGEEAIITAIDTNTSTNTATVDRAQTISSSAASLRAKHYVVALYGDSMGQRLESVFCKLLWRKLGFGGIVLNAGNVNSNAYSQSVSVTLSAGATLTVDEDAYDQHPWSARWEVPAGGSARWELLSHRANGVERPLRHGLAPHEMRFDTFVLVWRRAAGAFTVHRKRRGHSVWETVDTVADASAGSTAYASRRYTHDPQHDWQYELRTTSGTIAVPLTIIRNDQAPGYLNWSVARGSRKLTDFAALSSSDLGELCRIVGQPDTRIAYVLDADSNETVADATVELEADRALWQAAAPRTDHVWVQSYEPSTNQAGQIEWNRATEILALKYNDGLVPLYDFFGDFTDEMVSRGLLPGANDTHMNEPGFIIAAWLWFKQFGLEDIPTLREGRDISAQRGDFRTLRVLGRDVGAALTKFQTRPVTADRGLKFALTGNQALVGVGAMGAALGTGDFTISRHITVPGATTTTVIASISSAGSNAGPDIGEITVTYVNGNLQVALTNGSTSTNTYRWDHFEESVGGPGTQGVLTLRSDVANSRFDWFWNGEPIDGLVFTSVIGTGDPLGVWSGVGTDFAIFGAALADAPINYHAMAWRSRLTDAQIRAIAADDGPAGTNPDFWWDFRGRSGRAVRDVSGNGKHGLLRLGSAGSANNLVSANIAWAYPDASILGPLGVLNINATTTLVPGDNLLVEVSRNIALPATATKGDVISLRVNAGGAVTLTQAAGQQIKSGASATTVGTGGQMVIPDASATVLRCVTGGTLTLWVVESHTGAALTFA